MDRSEVIRINRSRRMRGLSPIPVPPKPEKKFGYEVIVDGTFEGFEPCDDKRLVIERVEQIFKGKRITLRRVQALEDRR